MSGETDRISGSEPHRFLKFLHRLDKHSSCHLQGKLHNEQLHNLYSSPQGDQIKEEINSYTNLVIKPEEKNHLKYLDVDERIILEWILEK